MAALLGRNAKITLDGNTVQNLYNWSINLESTPIEQPVFGDDWNKVHGLGVNKWSGSFEGIYDLTDTNGQVALRNAQLNSTTISGVRFYMDDTNYYAPNLSADATAGIYITGHEVTNEPEDVVRITYNFTGTGELTTGP